MKVAEIRDNNKGISLIEVIISMAILAIAAVSLLSYFVSATKYNAREKNRQTSLVLAQSIIEQCKDQNLEGIAKGFHITDASEFENSFQLVNPSKLRGANPLDNVEEVTADGDPIGTKGVDGSYLNSANTFQNSADGMLYYAIYNIEEDGNRYDALLTINTNGTAGKYQHINAEELYEIKAINAPENIVAVESVQYARAVTQIYNMHLEEYARQIASEVDPPPVQLSEDGEDDIKAIKEALKRKMVIELTEIGADKAKLKIFYEYYCDLAINPDILGCPVGLDPLEIDPPLYSETVTISLMKNIYLFFTKCSDNEQIDIRIDSSLEYVLEKLDLYLLVQAEGTGTVVPDCNVNIMLGAGLAEFGTVYSNAQAVTKNGVSIVKNDPVSKSAILRMMNVKVDIYRAGFLLNPGYLYATLESTK